MLADFIAEFTDGPTDPTGGHQEAKVAPTSYPTAPIRGKKGIDVMDIDDNAEVH